MTFNMAGQPNFWPVTHQQPTPMKFQAGSALVKPGDFDLADFEGVSAGGFHRNTGAQSQPRHPSARA